MAADQKQYSVNREPSGKSIPNSLRCLRGDEFFAEVSRRPPFTKLHPRVGAFLKSYLAKEKVIQWGDHSVVNTNFPPYPSPAFDQLAEQFGQLGDAATRRLYSVTLAVTNRCPFNCWHCYNAGRSQEDMPLAALRIWRANCRSWAPSWSR